MTEVSAYTATHRPIRRIEVKCDYRGELADGLCPLCGRYLKASPARLHRPNIHGAFGYIYYYANGETKTIKGGLSSA